MVITQLQHSLDKVYDTNQKDIVEAQLTEMFQLMEEE